MNIKIRTAVITDAKVINNFLTRLIHDEKQYDENINEKCIVYSFYENLIENKNNCILIAENNDNMIIGYLYGYVASNGDAYLEKTSQLEAIFVDEKFRGNNIGKKLVNKFILWSKNNNVKYIELKVCNENLGAINLYKKNGFNNIKSIMRLEIGE